MPSYWLLRCLMPPRHGSAGVDGEVGRVSAPSEAGPEAEGAVVRHVHLGAVITVAMIVVGLVLALIVPNIMRHQASRPVAVSGPTSTAPREPN